MVLLHSYAILFVAVETFRDLLAGKNLCALEQREKIHFVYTLQNLYIEKASAEFLEASKANVEVKSI